VEIGDHPAPLALLNILLVSAASSTRRGAQPVIHHFRARKRAIAIVDDVEVNEVKIRCELRIGHVPIVKDRLPKRLLCPARMQPAKPTHPARLNPEFLRDQRMRIVSL
jgi:hypothetical protein